MASRTEHFKKFSIVHGDIKVNLDLSRFEKQFREAQTFLDMQVMQDMKPYMPMVDGIFYNTTKKTSDSWAGTGVVCAAEGPFGRYLYEGKKMVNAATGKGPRKIPTGPGEYVLRYPEGAILKATDEPLDYNKNKNPKVTDHWFDEAKKNHCKAWVKGVKRIAGGG